MKKNCEAFQLINCFFAHPILIREGFENSTLKSKKIPVYWAIITTLCFKPLMSTTVFNSLMYYFTFVLCMRPRLMSKQAIMARALIYKALSLFMIKSLKTKLGRADAKAFRPSHATCGIIQRDCSQRVSLQLLLRFYLSC